MGQTETRPDRVTAGKYQIFPWLENAYIKSYILQLNSNLNITVIPNLSNRKSTQIYQETK